MSAHVLDLLSAYIDGELPEREGSAVDAHLRGCPECARHLEELRAVDAAARELDVVAPPGYFDALPARVRGRLRTPRAWRPPAWLWAAAAVLVLAVLTPITVRRTASPVPEATRTDDSAQSTPAPPAAAVAPGAEPEKAPEGGAMTAGAREKLAAAAKEDAPAPKDEAPAKRALPMPTAAPAVAGRLRENAAPAPPPAPSPVQTHSGPWAQAPTQAPAQAPAEAAQVDAIQRQAASRAEDEQKEAAPGLKKQAPAPAGKSERDQAPPEAMADAAATFAEAPGPGEDARFHVLLARRPSSLEAARKLRDDWHAFVQAHPDSPRADEARVRAMEASVLAFRLGQDPRDRDRARREARAYLARSDAAQAARVREMLQALDR